MKNGDVGVSEIIGAIVLLAMAVSVFSVIYINVLSDDGPAPDAFLTIIGKIDDTGDVVFDHTLGENLYLDSLVILEIAGGDSLGGETITTNVRNLLSYNNDNIIDNNRWNIGERLIYHPDEPLNGDEIKEPVNVKAFLIDKVSNSLVFWGTLQVGYTGDKGGIWHFNESFWDKDETTYEVLDSSGRGNNGTAYNDANTSRYVVNSEANAANKSGYFNYLDGSNDFVVVPNAYSLNLRNKITIEAWIKPLDLDIGSGISNLKNRFGFTPFIINVSDNLFVVVSEDQSKNGIIQTVNISSLGNLSLTGHKFPGFGSAQANKMLRPVITRVNNDVFVVTYIDDDYHVHLKTFKIYSNGSIDYIGEELVFDDNRSTNNVPNRPSVIKVTNNIFTIAYWIDINGNSPPATATGVLKTVNISDSGFINYTGNMLIFDDLRGHEPDIIHVSGDIFAIVYRGPDDDGFLKTLSINSHGQIRHITDSGIDAELEFDESDCYEPDIIHVSGDIFAIVYRGGPYDDKDGWVKTVNIFSNGNINSIGYNIKFGDNCFTPGIINQYKDYYIIAYATDNTGNIEPGNYVSIIIKDNGNISLKGSRTPFEFDKCYDPMILKISDFVFGIIYEGKESGAGTGHPGSLISFAIEDLILVKDRGICKSGSYGIYANATKVYATINEKTINATINEGYWNHIVLTYDKNALSDQMKLYVNGGTPAETGTLKESIRITNSNLLFGNLYYGYIDEIAIFDYVISQEEINNHSNPLVGIWSYY